MTHHKLQSTSIIACNAAITVTKHPERLLIEQQKFAHQWLAQEVFFCKVIFILVALTSQVEAMAASLCMFSRPPTKCRCRQAFSQGDHLPRSDCSVPSPDRGSPLQAHAQDPEPALVWSWHEWDLGTLRHCKCGLCSRLCPSRSGTDIALHCDDSDSWLSGDETSDNCGGQPSANPTWLLL